MGHWHVYVTESVVIQAPPLRYGLVAQGFPTLPTSPHPHTHTPPHTPALLWCKLTSSFTISALKSNGTLACICHWVCCDTSSSIKAWVSCTRISYTTYLPPHTNTHPPTHTHTLALLWYKLTSSFTISALKSNGTLACICHWVCCDTSSSVKTWVSCTRISWRKKQTQNKAILGFVEHTLPIKNNIRCSTSKGQTLQVKSILSFEFDVLELFISFKMTPYLSKFIKAFKFYHWKRIKNSYCFL